MKQLEKIIIICGHYGSGKTNFSVNLALDLKKTGEPVLLADLDIVNPYFRTSDHAKMLETKGIKVLSPTYANTNVDAPAIPATMYSAFNFDGYAIFDVGGDDSGATVMGQFFKNMEHKQYDMLYVINNNRSMITNAFDAAEMLLSIQATSRLKATYIVNNSHLKDETTIESIKQSASYANEISTLLNLPIYCTTVPEYLLKEEEGKEGKEEREKNKLNINVDIGIENPYPIKVFVKTPWEEI